MIEPKLYAHLVAEVTEVEGRVYPNIMPQNCVKPALVYTTISEVTACGMGGWCGDERPKVRMQVDVFSTHYKEKKLIKESVLKALESFELPVSSISNRDLYEDETELYRELIEFKI